MKHAHTPKNVHQESTIYILPNTFTAGNLFFGFLAIILCVQGKFNADKAGESITKVAELITPSNATISNSTGYYLLAIPNDTLSARESNSLPKSEVLPLIRATLPSRASQKNDAKMQRIAKR